MGSKAPEISVNLDLDRETKNTGRYIEDVPDGEKAVLGTVYIPKRTLERLRGDSVMPSTIAVTISL